MNHEGEETIPEVQLTPERHKKQGKMHGPDPISNGRSCPDGIVLPLASVEGREGEKAKEGKIDFVIPTILFFLTVFTTLVAGARMEGGLPFKNSADLLKGAPFSLALMSILFVHEMGHYITSKRYGVKTTPPYFIPGPWPGNFMFAIGTFGAFIRMKSPIVKKTALLDIGAAGPIAGFVVSVLVTMIGLQSSQLVKIGDVPTLLELGNPLIFTAIASILGKNPPAGFDIALNSVAFAGWLGFFVTSLNLLPIGQLDGGHIAYALVGKKQRYVSIGMVLLLIVLGTTGWAGWLVWAILSAALGVSHPPTMDESAPLDFKHQLVGWASLVLFIITLTPTPFITGG
ncbi:MAG: site-2 protease family protein [Nitrospiria bacterium]